MKTLAILTSLALLLLAVPAASAEDLSTPACGWCCDQMDTYLQYAQCMANEAYGNGLGGPVGDVVDAYWGALMTTYDFVESLLRVSTSSDAVNLDQWVREKCDELTGQACTSP